MNWQETFSFQGKALYYNRINFNNLGERAVEIPIAFDFLANLQQESRIMEVGNVLAHYENSLSEYLGLRKRRIVDKFEVEIGVDNVDLMEITSDHKYDGIISISTVEHIGQGAEPSSRSYGEEDDIERDLEAPLKAVAKIYDLLASGGKALITVPFGKLIDAGWFIQFNQDYLNLLVTKYQIPKDAISFHYLQKLGMDLQMTNSRQKWIASEATKLNDIEFNWPFPCANAIAVIELTKQAEMFTLKIDLPPTDIHYHEHYPVTKDEYADLLDPNFINYLDSLREINLIFYPDWSQSEESLWSDIEQVVKIILEHPDLDKILLLIDTSAVSEDNAELLLSGVMMNLLIEEDIKITQDPKISLIGNLSKIQQRAFFSRLHYQITLNPSPESERSNAIFEKITLCDAESLRKSRAIQVETGLWEFRE